MFGAQKATPWRKTALTALCIAPSLASCTVHSEPTIQGSAGNAAGLREIAILSSDRDEGLRISFKRQLQAAFRSRGVPASSTAQVVADYAIAIMDDDMSIVPSGPDDENDISVGTPDGRLAPRIGSLLDRCDTVRYRASLVLYNRSTGERIHRAQSEGTGCAKNAAPLGELAQALVRDALLAPN